MIEVILTGAWRGVPHEVGAWVYALRRGGELLHGGRGTDRPREITSRLSAEAAALAFALEEAAREWAGEDLVIRTASAGLQGLFVRRGLGVARDLARWHSRAREAARVAASVRILPATPLELAALEAEARGLLPGDVGTPLARASDPAFQRRPRP